MDISFRFIIEIFLNGLVLGTSYALMAVGLAMVFGVLKILNFAHGELFMLGGFVSWVLYRQLGVPFPVGVIAAMITIGGLGIGIERVFFRPTRKEPFRGSQIPRSEKPC